MKSTKAPEKWLKEHSRRGHSTKTQSNRHFQSHNNIKNVTSLSLYSSSIEVGLLKTTKCVYSRYTWCPGRFCRFHSTHVVINEIKRNRFQLHLIEDSDSRMNHSILRKCLHILTWNWIIYVVSDALSNWSTNNPEMNSQRFIDVISVMSSLNILKIWGIDHFT